MEENERRNKNDTQPKGYLKLKLKGKISNLQQTKLVPENTDDTIFLKKTY